MSFWSQGSRRAIDIDGWQYGYSRVEDQSG
jgi:hypothetical protein